MNKFNFLFILLLGSLSLTAQQAEPSLLQLYEDSLVALSTTVMQDTSRDNRISAFKQFEEVLEQALSQSNSFDYPFEKLEAVSIQKPKDNSFRIFTLQLYVDANEYKYFGAIQMNTPELNWRKLTDQSDEIESLNYEKLGADNWYGAVYYNLLECEDKKGKYYLLFGFDGYSLYNRRKLVDVLRINGDRISFGDSVFAEIEEGRRPITQNRLVMEYSAEAAIKLNYDPALEVIIFDHLRTVGSPYPGVEDTNIPDGTYQGYKYKKGQWVYQEKLFDVIMEEPLFPQPILDNRKSKDIFGKQN